MYADFECPLCGLAWERVRNAGLRLGIRHFPVRSSHPRALAAACAAEAAADQGRFWEMVDALFADQGRLEDPHLWERATSLGLDLDRFEDSRRSAETEARVLDDFRNAIRAGVATTPSFLVDGVLHSGTPSAADVALWECSRP